MMRRPEVLSFASRELKQLPGLSVFLAGETDAVVGWGMKASGQRAQQRAKLERRRLLLLEDGFLRSVGRDDPPLSVVVDDLGIYYDASSPSRLEQLIAQPLDEEQIQRARELIRAWRELRVSKYNEHRDWEGELPAEYVLVCDQTAGDASVLYGAANTATFPRMLEAALAENPQAKIVVKIHPDTTGQRKRGYFDALALANMSRVVVVNQSCHATRLIEHASAVYVATSQMGFEALLWGKPVRVFGMPFYAGWGLTQDDRLPPARRGKATLEQLVHAALVRYPRYRSPDYDTASDVETVLASIGFQRKLRERFARRVYALDFSFWKRRAVRCCMPGHEVRFVASLDEVPDQATVLAWGVRHVDAVARRGLRAVRLEDGFLRSVGLGADLIQPVSWVVDGQGMYFDATKPSDLEDILLTTRFTPELLTRAEALRSRIAGAGLTKYNVGVPGWARPSGPRTVILVPGQVESDASLEFGAPGVRTNAELLEAVRTANPDCYLVYKPHPDVVAGLRAASLGDRAAENWCDEMIPNVAMADLLRQVDKVHVMTSLTGFEALLRGLQVTCHGQPFYAGWGLTTDVLPVSRRNRQLSLQELVAGSLILYPLYFSRKGEKLISPERALDELIAWQAKAGCSPSLWRKLVRVVLRRVVGVR